MTAVSPILDRKTFTGTAAHGGGTFTADYAVPTDRGVVIKANVIFSAQTGAPAHLTIVTNMVTQYCVRNNNGTLAEPTAMAGSSNPRTAANLVAADVETDEFAGGAPSSATFSISTTNARLTATNNASSQDADVTVVMEVLLFG